MDLLAFTFHKDDGRSRREKCSAPEGWISRIGLRSSLSKLSRLAPSTIIFAALLYPNFRDHHITQLLAHAHLALNAPSETDERRA